MSVRWDIISQKEILKTIPFAVEELQLKCPNDSVVRPYYRLNCPDWVNVLPVTADGHAVLIRQDRAGSLSNVLETPGGTIDPNEKDATMAIARELEEETGYCSQRILPLGSTNPNPAIMSNKIHFFVALGCVINPQRQHFPDETESIKTELVDCKELDSLVRFGQIAHGLSALCILLASRYVDIGSKDHRRVE